MFQIDFINVYSEEFLISIKIKAVLYLKLIIFIDVSINFSDHKLVF